MLWWLGHLVALRIHARRKRRPRLRVSYTRNGYRYLLTRQWKTVRIAASTAAATLVGLIVDVTGPSYSDVSSSITVMLSDDSTRDDSGATLPSRRPLSLAGH
jgi:hypothetical protein